MALSSDMSFWINTLLFKKLSEVCPSLSLNGEDRRVYEILIHDFKDYLRYLSENFMKVEEERNKINVQIIEIIGDYPRISLAQNLMDTKEMAEFVNSWVPMWFKKWQQRTKIIFGKEDLPKSVISLRMNLSNELTADEYEDVELALKNKLIQYGEICCVDIMANSLLKKELEEHGGKEMSLQDKVNLIPRMQRIAKDMSYKHGPLVFVKPDKDYYLREFRDDGTSKIV